MNSRLLLVVMLVFGVNQTCVFLESATAGMLGKSVSRAIARKATEKRAMQQAYARKILRRDAIRDSKTQAKVLAKPQYVNRYTSSKQANAEQLNGISSKTHMTSRIPLGRPISAATAKQRYGLNNKPDVRMTIRVPKGHPVKKNKVIGGKPGYGEMTSPKHIPSKNVMKVEKIH